MPIILLIVVIRYIVKELNKMFYNDFLKKSLLFAFAVISSVAVFIIIYESISYIKYDSNTVTELKKEVENKNIPLFKESLNTLEQHRNYIECMEKNNNLLIDCDNLETSSKKSHLVIETLAIKGYIPFKDLNKSNIVIKIIYLFLILSLAQQVYLFFCIKVKFILDIYDFHKSEWSINVAPMFGLLGTFFSMAMLLNENTENIDTVLIKNFFDAVMTTIIGIIFYIINFYLKISIYPKISEQNND